jgi:hypothetical protein
MKFITALLIIILIYGCESVQNGKTVNEMNWPSAFSILFALIGLALLFHGFPDFHIGKKETHYHNDNEEEIE